MSEKQEPGSEQEEDLLADFRDILGKGDGAVASSGGDDDSMAELDAFLNEFGQGAGTPTAEVDDMDAPAEAEAGDEAIPELHADEFDADEAVPELHAEAFGADDEAVPELEVEEFGAELAAPTSSAGAITDEAIPALLHEDAAEDVAMPDELNLDVEPEAASGVRTSPAAGEAMDDLFDTPITATPPSAFVDEDDELIADEAPPPRAPGLDVSSVGVALFSLVIAAVVGWFAVTLHVQVGDLSAEVAQLRQQSAPAASVPDARLQQELGRLNQRLNEMAVTIDGPMSHLNESNQRELDSIFKRLDELDQTVNSLRDALAKRDKGAAVANSAPQQATATKAPAPKVASKPRGSWVVNVASLTDAAAAAAEQKRLKQAGIDTEVQKAVMDGHTWYRVRVTGFASREEAQVYADMAKGKLEGSPWVGQR